MTDEEQIGREGVQELAGREYNKQVLVCGFSGIEGRTQLWLVTVPVSLDPQSEEGVNEIVAVLTEGYGLQEDTAVVISDLGSDRPVAFTPEDGELMTSFVGLD